MFDFYLYPDTIADQHKNYKHNKVDSILEKYPKGSDSVSEIMDQIETLRCTEKSTAGRIAERVKLKKQKAESLKRQKQEQELQY